MQLKLRNPTSHEYCPVGTKVIVTPKKEKKKSTSKMITRKRGHNTETTSSQENTSRQRQPVKKDKTCNIVAPKIIAADYIGISDDDNFQTTSVFRKVIMPNRKPKKNVVKDKSVTTQKKSVQNLNLQMAFILIPPQ